MADVPEDPVTAAIKELVKQLPVKKVYKDGLSPAVKETGGALEDIIKAVRLALAPIQYLAALQDRYSDFLDKSVRRVPEKNRTAPPTQILGPVLEGIRYEPEGTPIDEMFSELLSSSMDSERQGEAHPSYPIIIRQLSADEARILAMLNVRTYEFVRTFQLDRSTNRFHSPHIERDELPREGLDYPDRVQFYIDHLDQLSLAGVFEYKNQQHIGSGSSQTGTREFRQYRLTPMGEQFMRACSPDTDEKA